jgi:hypothetical protein
LNLDRFLSARCNGFLSRGTMRNRVLRVISPLAKREYPEVKKQYWLKCAV